MVHLPFLEAARALPQRLVLRRRRRQRLPKLETWASLAATGPTRQLLLHRLRHQHLFAFDAQTRAPKACFTLTVSSKVATATTLVLSLALHLATALLNNAKRFQRQLQETLPPLHSASTALIAPLKQTLYRS